MGFFLTQKMKKAIYSVITGGYDMIPVAPIFKGWDSIMFTDYPIEDETNGWIIRQLQVNLNPLVQSRDIKIRSHIHLPEYDLVCYVDGNQKILIEPPNEPVWYTHARRQNIFQEAEQIIKNGRFPRDIIDAQIEYYKSKGYEDCGLYLNGFSVRNNKNADINHLHDVWFEETCRFAPRDQLSLPFAIWNTGIEPENIVYPKEKESYAVVVRGHKQKYHANN